MSSHKECAICGAIYTNPDRHQAWHDELDAWTQSVEREVQRRLRERARAARLSD